MAAWAAETEADAKRDEWTYAKRDAEIRYIVGDVAAPSDIGRSAYRSVCRQGEPERLVTLDAMRENGQMHAFVVGDWYAHNCTPSPKVAWSGYAVISRETGRPATLSDVTDDALAVCLADAGLPPSREYDPTGAELLAKARRDACDAAQ